MASRTPSTSSPAPRLNRLLSMKYNQRSQFTFDVQGLYGPKAVLVETLSDEQRKRIRLEDPACEHHLYWMTPPDTILIMKKFKDAQITKKFKQLCTWIIENDHMDKIVIEPSIMEDPLISDDEDFVDIRAKFRTWNEDNKQIVLQQVDWILCLGGDGTLLYTSSLFKKSVPPIMSISMGSLGFLTPFSYENYTTDIIRVLNGGVSLTMRHRLECKVTTKDHVDQYYGDMCPLDVEEFNNPTVMSKFSALTTSPKMPTSMDNNKKETVINTYLVMNEVVIDRGPSPYITNLEVFCNGRMITTVQADGLCRCCLAARGICLAANPNGIELSHRLITSPLQDSVMTMEDCYFFKKTCIYTVYNEAIQLDMPRGCVISVGIIVATPTGSTAYALAAGASVVHPSTPSMLICPICPHSLSFRPVVVPSGVEICIRVSSQSRNSAWAAFDGRNRTEVKHGESVVITTASSPVPSINNTGHVTDWFDSLATCLHWNVREVQKSM